jgi:nucleoside phosphorylase
MKQEAFASQSCEVIILTALPVEFRAIVAHLQETLEVMHPETGTIYQVGSFPGKQDTWHVAVAQIGMGGLSAASETERASNFFHPRIMLFVGIAGGLKDVRHGDVVVATKIYAYESGKAEARFKPRPELWRASYALEQRAGAEANNQEWLSLLDDQHPDPEPHVLLGPLAAGEKVLATQRSSVYRFLQATYGDSLAVEMEGHGFLQAVQANQNIYALVIRGVSDLLADKVTAEKEGWREVAAQHAAAFAFQVLAKFTIPGESPLPPARLGFNEALPSIRSEIRDDMFIIEERTRGFVGRQFVFDAIQRFIENAEIPRGYFLIHGQPGIGKTTLAAQLVKMKGYVHHFNSRSRGVTKTDQFLKNVCAQLIARYKLGYTYLPARAGQDGDFLLQLLTQISHQLTSGEQLVIVIDALDEVAGSELAPGANILNLPEIEILPSGIYMVATMRTGASVHLDIRQPPLYIDHHSEDNKADIREYIQQKLVWKGVQDYIIAQGISDEYFIELLSEKSQGNFMYLYHVLPAIADGKYGDQNIKDLPTGLQKYYETHWQRMRDADKETWFRYKLPILMVLAAAKESISIDMIEKFSGVRERDRIIDALGKEEWGQFLETTPDKRYSLYHASFCDFLAKKDELEEGVSTIRTEQQIFDALIPRHDLQDSSDE